MIIYLKVAETSNSNLPCVVEFHTVKTREKNLQFSVLA